MDAAVELFSDALEDQVQTVPVVISEENRLAGVAAKDDMIDSAGIMDAGFAWHGAMLHKNSNMSSLTVCSNS